MAVAPHHEKKTDGAGATGGGSLPATSAPQILAQWFVVCDFEGRLVGDVRLTNPPQVRGKPKELRQALWTMMQALDPRNLIAVHSGPPSTQETTKQRETMNDIDEQNDTGIGSQEEKAEAQAESSQGTGTDTAADGARADDNGEAQAAA